MRRPREQVLHSRFDREMQGALEREQLPTMAQGEACGRGGVQGERVVKIEGLDESDSVGEGDGHRDHHHAEVAKAGVHVRHADGASSGETGGAGRLVAHTRQYR